MGVPRVKKASAAIAKRVKSATKPLKNANPVAARIHAAFDTQPKEPGKRKAAITGLRRVDVIEEKLCDDVLEYLAPTLEPYKGCTLIDVYPGACIWSSKLHDFLKPKHHILMEPDDSYVKTFVTPLLEKPGSTYRHTHMAGAHPRAYWDNWNALLEDGKLIPPRRLLDKDDPKLRQIDPTFLVTGNLARKTVATGSMARPVRFAELILQQMTWAGLTNDLFHRGGLVRQLWWVPETTRLKAFTPNPASGTSLSAGFSLTAHMNEVVGVNAETEKAGIISAGDLPRQSTPGLDFQDQKNLHERMSRMGMLIPAGRIRLSKIATEANEDDPCESPYRIHARSRDEIAKVIEECEQRDLDRSEKEAESTVAGNGKVWKARYTFWEEFMRSNAYPQVRQLIENAKTEYRHKGTPFEAIRFYKVVFYCDMQLRIINLEVSLKDYEEKQNAGKQDLELRARIAALDEKSQASVLPALKGVLDGLIEEQLGFWRSPQHGMFYRRDYEPFKASEKDYWPHTELSLLDVVPSTRDMRVPDLADRRECVSTAQELNKYLYLYRVQPLAHTLDRIATNAAQDLIPMVPAITDPRQGGRLDPRNMKVRMLTNEMFEALVKAWFEWPFRPSEAELAITMSHDMSGISGHENVSESVFGAAPATD